MKITEAKLVRYNPRRKARGAEAAEVTVVWDDGEHQTLWMSERNLKYNIKLHGPLQGFNDALEAYKANQTFPPIECGVAVGGGANP